MVRAWIGVGRLYPILSTVASIVGDSPSSANCGGGAEGVRSGTTGAEAKLRAAGRNGRRERTANALTIRSGRLRARGPRSAPRLRSATMGAVERFRRRRARARTPLHRGDGG